jgi:4-hydroxy-2-oxoheptanedioate aldolase
MLTNTPVRKKLALGQPVIGTWNTLAAPLVTEVLAHAGLDFQIIDLEHGPFVLDQVHLHVSACEGAAGCSPLIRIPANEAWMAIQALDQGAHGIVVPHIDNAQAALSFTEAVKYHPQGMRGFTPFSKAGGFSNLRTAEYVGTANRETLAVVIIESLEGLSNAEEIAAQDGIDVVYFGAYDLSQALGHPGEPRHPDVVAAIRQGADQVKQYGKCAGGFVPQSRDDIKWLLDLGLYFITYDVDSSILFHHVRNLRDWFATETAE